MQMYEVQSIYFNQYQIAIVLHAYLHLLWKPIGFELMTCHASSTVQPTYSFLFTIIPYHHTL